MKVKLELHALLDFEWQLRLGKLQMRVGVQLKVEVEMEMEVVVQVEEQDGLLIFLGLASISRLSLF